MDKTLKANNQSENNKRNVFFQTVSQSLSSNNSLISTTNCSSQAPQLQKIQKEFNSFFMTENLYVLSRQKYGPNAVMLSSNQIVNGSKKYNKENPQLRRTLDSSMQQYRKKTKNKFMFTIGMKSLQNLSLQKVSRQESAFNMQRQDKRSVSTIKNHKLKFLSPVIRSQNSKSFKNLQLVKKINSCESSPTQNFKNCKMRLKKEIYKDFINMLIRKDIKQRYNIVCDAISQAKLSKILDQYRTLLFIFHVTLSLLLIINNIFTLTSQQGKQRPVLMKQKVKILDKK